MPTRHIAIFEPAPCADTLFEITRDAAEGYVAASGGVISLLSGSRLRPREMSTYAGGKATNVARVMDALLRASDSVLIDLIVFRPDSTEGRYIAELQSSELSRVRVTSVIVDSTARFCINVSDPSSQGTPVEFNISPRVIWQPSAKQTALEVAAGIESDLLVLAGNPPAGLRDQGSGIGEEGSGVRDQGSGIGDQGVGGQRLQVMVDLPASIIARALGAPHMTVDIGGSPLALILKGPRHPDVIKINYEEYAAVDKTAWLNYSGVLVVTDAAGCNVWEKGPSGPSVRVPAATGHTVYSTVGAGDAAHAGFTLAMWVWGYDPVRAARFGMAAAAAAVSSPEGTRGVTRDRVNHFFRALER